MTCQQMWPTLVGWHVQPRLLPPCGCAPPPQPHEPRQLKPLQLPPALLRAPPLPLLLPAPRLRQPRCGCAPPPLPPLLYVPQPLPSRPQPSRPPPSQPLPRPLP